MLLLHTSSAAEELRDERQLIVRQRVELTVAFSLEWTPDRLDPRARQRGQLDAAGRAGHAADIARVLETSQCLAQCGPWTSETGRELVGRLRALE